MLHVLHRKTNTQKYAQVSNLLMPLFKSDPSSRVLPFVFLGAGVWHWASLVAISTEETEEKDLIS